MQRVDPYQARARELCQATGVDPDSRVYKTDPDTGERLEPRGQPAWCHYRQQARDEHKAREVAELAAALAIKQKDCPYPAPQPAEFAQAPLAVVGRDHEASTLAQMDNCMAVGQVVAGAICADGHLGYAQPVGASVAYKDQISISGVGYDIACGNMAVKLDMPYSAIRDEILPLMNRIRENISFGTGRVNETDRVEHVLFDDDEAWKKSGREDFKNTARKQLGTIGGGNHYVDIFEDDDGATWIGVHFGSRGLGHSTAKLYIEAAGGKDGVNVAPCVVGDKTEIGERYLAGMELAGRYAYAGREWVTEKVRSIIGGNVIDMVHNHHNFAWRENHRGQDVWVVRKGATPAWVGQRGFVGGSMGDDAVIIEGADVPGSYGLQARLLFSTVHGAGRLFGRKEAIRRYTRQQMEDWLRSRGTILVGGEVDESPMAYRRLHDVLADQGNTIRVLKTLHPRGVAMAGAGEFDPYKD
jgi:tRNA-splicing ligase RtcB (3'-phosphate/5'-hydroxy nucleic acid ligase)